MSDEELDVGKLMSDSLIAMLSGLGKNQEGKIWWKDDNDENICIDIIDSSIEHCVIEWYYDDTRKRAKIEVKNGKLDGLYVEWFVDGEKSYEAQYQDGNILGPRLWYNKDGTIRKRLESGVVNPGPTPINAQNTRPTIKHSMGKDDISKRIQELNAPKTDCGPMDTETYDLLKPIIDAANKANKV